MQVKEKDKFNYRLWKYDGQPGELIPLLQSAQDHFGYIPRQAMNHISRITGIPESEIFGVITFYSQFRLRPIGKYLIKVCTGTACHVAGSRSIVEIIQEELGIDIGGTTSDGLFSLFSVACLGCCSLAPVIMINDETHGNLTIDSVSRLLKKISLKHRK